MHLLFNQKYLGIFEIIWRTDEGNYYWKKFRTESREFKAQLQDKPNLCRRNYIPKKKNGDGNYTKVVNKSDF